MKKISLLLLFLFLVTIIRSQQDVITVSDNLVAEGIPPLPATYVSAVKNYTESRAAFLVDWHPVKREMLIGTRFGNSNQLHHVKFPGGDRKQITFFDEPVGSAVFESLNGSYFLFLKDIGGNEFSQIYRYDLSNNQVTLLTDGKRSQNGGII
jgi:hypothetical protein